MSRKELSIPKYPEQIFVVELEEYILVTGFPITECVFAYTRFDNAYDKAFVWADELAVKCKKLVVNAVDFHIHDPLVYDPVEIQKQMERLNKLIQEERAKIKEAHAKLAVENLKT